MVKQDVATWLYLSVCVLDCGNVGVSECAVNESEDEAGLADAPGPKDHHPVVVALLRHREICLFPVCFVCFDFRLRDPAKKSSKTIENIYV